MFTGIITETGTVARISRSKITIRASRALLRKLNIGTSIAVDGTCLTVVEKDKNSFATNIIPETRQRTTLEYVRKNDMVNLELPANPTSFLSGHLVQGHVDGIARLQHITKKDSGHILKFSIPPSLSKYVIEKGSVTIDGIALTIIKAKKDYFTVGIIPHTWRSTAIHTMQIGDMANIEVDVIAKYIEKLLRKQI